MDNDKPKMPDFSVELPPPRIFDDEIQKRLQKEIKGWKLIESPLPENPTKNRKELYKVYYFESFDDVVDFMVELKVCCEIIPHHPRIENTWRTLKIYLSTWALDYNVSYKDILLAKNIDKIYRKKYPEGTIKAKNINKEKKLLERGIKLLISENEFDAVFKTFEKYFLLNREKESPSELINVKGAYNDLRNREIAALLSESERRLEYNKLRKSLLDMLKILT
jgi:pterin-4a-carbinolamine dehydratase